MPKAKPLTVAAAGFLLTACSNDLRGGAHCGARTQAVGSPSDLASVTSEKNLFTNVNLPDHTPGGFLDLDFYEDATGKPLVNHEKALAAGAATKRTRRCTAVVSFDIGGPPDALRVWTADHCVQPGIDVSATLWFYSNGGYAPIPIRPDAFEIASRARSESLPLPDATREFFLRSFNTHDTESSRVGSQSCKAADAKVTASLGTDFSHACFSMSDLAVYRARLASPLSSFSPQQAAIWAAAKKAQVRFREYYATSNSTLATRIGEEAFQQAFGEMMDLRRREASQAFVERARAAQCDAAGGPCDTASASLVARLHTSFFGEKSFSEEGVQKFSDELRSHPNNLDVAVKNAFVGIGAGLVLDAVAQIRCKEARLPGLTDLQMARNRYRCASDVVWGAIKEGESASGAVAKSALPKVGIVADVAEFNKRFKYTFQANIRPVDSPTSLAWRWLSSHRHINHQGMSASDGYLIHLNNFDDVDAFKRVLVLSSHVQKSPYRFEKGDSGSMVGMFVFPFGTLSTVNGEETEGVPVTILPSPGSYSESSGPVAGSSSGDGRQANGAGGKAAGGREVAAGGGKGSDASSREGGRADGGGGRRNDSACL